jgi:electron transfer flavoprotein beta subunit
MKVMVCLKQVPHQDARLDVKSDGSWIQEDNIKFEINSYDTYAVEEALRMKDKSGAEVVVVSIGPDRVTQALRTALGMGADRAIHVNDPAAIGADSLGTAKILAAIAKAENADVIFAGLMADDGNGAAIPPMVAELLDIPSATGVLAMTADGGSITAERELEGGALEVVQMPTPCLIAIQSGANQVRYASL